MSRIFNKTSRMVLRINVELVQQMSDSRFRRISTFLLPNFQAAESAIPTLDEFTASMHWATYRASKPYILQWNVFLVTLIDPSLALRRHGSWRRDLNVELINPFTRNIAHSWSKIFESDLFASFRTSTVDVINALINEVKETAAPGLKDRAKLQGEACIEEACAALTKAVELVKDAMNREQKEISRIMAPHVQAQLVEGYDRAMEERGVGSVARQKVNLSD